MLMNLSGKVKTAATFIGGAALLLVAVVALVTFIAAIGGLIGALIAVGYNLVLDASLDPMKAALLGSIILILGAGGSTGD
jgi:hypothetical protein